MLCPAKVKVGAMGRRWGKSESTGLDIVLYALENPNTIQTILAPEDDNTKEITEKIETFLLAIPGFGKAYRIVRSPTWRCVFADGHGLKRPTTIRARTLGTHGRGVRGRNAHRVIVDEAAFVKDEIMERVVTPLLADYDGDLILISTPDGRNHFWRDWQRGQDPLQPRYKSFQFPSTQNSYLPRGFLENERITKPERVWRIEYLAEFADAEGQVFRNVRACCTVDWEEAMPGREYCAGLDLARLNDFTVLTIIDKATKRVVFQDRFNRIDWSLQLERVGCALRRYNNASCLVEVNHVGDVVIEQMRRAGLNVRGFETTAASKPDLIDALSVAFEQSAVILPVATLCPVMVNELESYAYERTPGGYVRMNAPDGQHDDTVISLALAWRHAAEPPEHVIRFS